MCPVRSDASPPEPPAALVGLQTLVMTPQLQLAIRILADDVVALHARLDEATRTHATFAWHTPVESAIGPYPLPRAADIDAVAWRDEADGRWHAELVPAHRPVFAWRGRELPAAPREGAADEVLDAYRAALDAALGEPDPARDEVAWLARAFVQRARSIARVCEAIAAAQADYLCGAADRPLRVPVRTVAEAVGMHESTITRIAQGKSLEGPSRSARLAELVAVRKG